MLLILLVALLGWGAGIVVNYVADVFPYRRRLVKPFCHNCQANYPLLDYIFWYGRCESCRQRRSWRAPAVEILYVLGTVWLWILPPKNLNFILGFILLIYFGIVVLIDLEHRLIMHPVSMVGAVLGLGIGTWLHGIGWTLLGGAAGFGIMLALYGLGYLFARGLARLRGGSIDEEALGFGDVNLMGVLGLILGWPGVLVGLVLAVLIGGLVSGLYMLAMLITRRFRAFTAIPYGPFLVAAAIALLFFRASVLEYIGP
ncbi:MAG TPA: A24 family peptidase [Anaerolineales bacterium]|jgi:leader peptidase (prepilin peptidase)/N-methyltransferase|nr:A24 family peptidase [Anaerolineales bacterium]